MKKLAVIAGLAAAFYQMFALSGTIGIPILSKRFHGIAVSSRDHYLHVFGTLDNGFPQVVRVSPDGKAERRDATFFGVELYQFETHHLDAYVDEAWLADSNGISRRRVDEVDLGWSEEIDHVASGWYSSSHMGQMLVKAVRDLLEQVGLEAHKRHLRAAPGDRVDPVEDLDDGVDVERALTRLQPFPRRPRRVDDDRGLGARPAVIDGS